MRDILALISETMKESYEESSLLEPLKSSPFPGLITDFDGVLSPIVKDPSAAQLTKRNLQLLQKLREKLPLVAIVSGRAVEELQKKVGLSGITYIGNHGMEQWLNNAPCLIEEAKAARPALEQAKQHLNESLLPGCHIEDKRATITLHFRNAVQPDRAANIYREQTLKLAEQLDLKWMEGQKIFELRPKVEVTKGTALRSLITQHKLEKAIFLGDDTTDVDALKMARHLRQAGSCHAIGIGALGPESPPSVEENADLTLAGVPEVEAFLQSLIQKN